MGLGKHDVFRNVNSWNKSIASEWSSALELRGSSNDQKIIRQRIIEYSSLHPGDTVVEIGCGVGMLLADCLKVVSPNGLVIGVEPQPVFASHAKARLKEMDCKSRTEIRLDSAEALGIADNIADACIAQTVLIHLPEPTLHAAIREMVRITKSGGHVVSVDQDGDTWVIDHPDREITRKIVQFNSDQRFADGWTGRRLRRLFGECGLKNLTIEAWNHIDTERSSYLFGSCVRLANAAAESEYITLEQCDKWLRTLEELAAHGYFFSSITYFAIVGETV